MQSPSINSADVFQLALPHLYHREFEHSGIYPKRIPDCFLRLRVTVESHHEVMAGGMRGLMLSDLLREVGDVPVVDTADDAAVGDDLHADGFDDSEKKDTSISGR